MRRLFFLESLHPGGSFKYAGVAKRSNIDCTTLLRRHRGVMRLKENQYKNQRLLNSQQVKTLISYINKVSERGLFPISEILRNFAKEISGIKPGKHWPSRFLIKYQNKLISRYTTGINSIYKRADLAFKYTLYFELLARKIKEYKIQSENIYNIDKKGFLIKIFTKSKRIFSKHYYKQNRIK